MAGGVQGLKIHITGIVQGVGFRPFIYRLAQEYNIRGTVLNNSQGVFIEAWGEELESFINSIYKELPPAAYVEHLTTEELDGVSPDDFKIIKSQDSGDKTVFISPDLALCKDCAQELENEKDRRHDYAFINCTNCGPRYSIIKDVPYDRPFTSMAKFPMCEACLKEYEDPLDRRFHAQPNACAKCGPHYWLVDRNGQEVEGGIAKAKELLQQGKIVAVKGIGGFHLSCNAYNEMAVKTLRQRKRREAKALAVMVKDVNTAKKLGDFSPEAEELLCSAAAPIVLVRKKVAYPLPEDVAPHNDKIGIMLAYAPIHHLLLNEGDVLVMTSANLSQEPMLYNNDLALTGLKNVADYFLLHNRDIVNPVDDSVINMGGEKIVVRRGRGLAPVPVKLPPAKNHKNILALGGELKNTFAVGKNDFAFLSPHLGDLENQPTYELYKRTLKLYYHLFAFEPDTVVVDKHPEYFSTKYGESLGLPIVQVQHHHGHIASVLAEHNIDHEVIGVALDGTGYGDDNTLWGGEFFIADLRSYKRVAHFPKTVLPGGAKAIKEPWRLGLVAAYNLFGEDYLKHCPHLNYAGGDLLLAATIKGVNMVPNTSAGRVFDTISSLLNICQSISYEGQAAIELELWAKKASAGEVLPFKIVEANKMYSFDFTEFYSGLLRVKEEQDLAYAAYSAHLTLARAIGTMVKLLSEQYGLKDVALSGGVCQNSTLMAMVKNELQDFNVYLNREIPPNDGGLSYGQLAVARALEKED